MAARCHCGLPAVDSTAHEHLDSWPLYAILASVRRSRRPSVTGEDAFFMPQAYRRQPYDDDYDPRAERED